MVGRTPMVRLEARGLEQVELYCKLEFNNPTGSVKDRAARYMIDHGLASGRINEKTLLVESSSGNFGIALAALSARRKLRFCCVIDPRINAINEMLIRSLGAEVVCVTERDPTGGYLQTRLRKVRSILATTPNSYWLNQYANPINAEAYYTTLGTELCEALPRLDYVFVGVSSGGTISGISRRLKEHFPKVRVIAVDVLGSVIFGGAPRPRWIPGIGASIVPDILSTAKIDEVVQVDEASAVRACHELLEAHSIFVGGSSGAALAAMRSYFHGKTFDTAPVVATIFPDRGDRYAGTIYNPDWCDQLFGGTMQSGHHRAAEVAADLQ
ncbi:2,3-diaminopropionate biosynthesis protein SbnA [Pendulispora rubella]|uniref:N-(2-amino-2-carboxyethyl)-L-glutamate synthase n=1 Tax=Pendulispora rubella TaxID=2741070 RepID=A0ABZ2KSE5_9BACT